MTIKIHNWSDEQGNPRGGVSYGPGFTISWQQGPIVGGTRNGAFLLDILAVCKEKLEYYQRGPFACEENAHALISVASAIDVLTTRKDRREAAGTLGTHEPD